MKRFHFVRPILLLLFTLWNSSSPREIVLTADVWAPYTMNPDSGKEGYLIDIARAIFEKNGDSVTYIIRPYSRAILETVTGKSDGVVGIYRKDAEAENLITPINELGISINSFFTRREDNWDYDTTKRELSFEEKRIAVIQDYVFSEIQEYLQANKNSPKVQYIFGTNPLEMNLRKLINNRIDIIIDDEIVILYTAQITGYSDQIRKANSLSEQNQVVIGFSKENPYADEYAQLISEGINSLRETGELNVILKKYGIEDWQKQ